MKNNNAKISDSALKMAKENFEAKNKEDAFGFCIISIFFGGNSENRNLFKSFGNDYLLRFHNKFGNDNFLGYISNRVGADGNVCINTSNSLYKKAMDNLDPRAVFLEASREKCDIDKLQCLDFGNDNGNILISSAEAIVQGFDISDEDIDSIVEQLMYLDH